MALALAGLCSGLAQSSPAKEAYSSFVYQYRTTPCLGTCPVYQLTIYSDGRALYRGQHQVTFADTFLVQLPSTAIDSLRYYLAQSRFASLDSSYDNTALSDLPGREHLLFQPLKRSTHRVWSRVDPPARLRRLEAYLHRLHQKYFQ